LFIAFETVEIERFNILARSFKVHFFSIINEMYNEYLIVPGWF